MGFSSNTYCIRSVVCSVVLRCRRKGGTEGSGVERTRVFRGGRDCGGVPGTGHFPNRERQSDLHMFNICNYRLVLGISKPPSDLAPISEVRFSLEHVRCFERAIGVADLGCFGIELIISWYSKCLLRFFPLPLRTYICMYMKTKMPSPSSAFVRAVLLRHARGSSFTTRENVGPDEAPGIIPPSASM